MEYIDYKDVLNRLCKLNNLKYTLIKDTEHYYIRVITKTKNEIFIFNLNNIDESKFSGGVKCNKKDPYKTFLEKSFGCEWRYWKSNDNRDEKLVRIYIPNNIEGVIMELNLHGY